MVTIWLTHNVEAFGFTYKAFLFRPAKDISYVNIQGGILGCDSDH